MNESVGGGTLSYIASVSSGTCYWYSDHDGHPLTWTRIAFYGFSYTGSAGLTQGLAGTGTDTYLSSNPQGYNNCPITGASPYNFSMPGYGFDITFSPCNSTTCNASYASVASGYVNPKYIIAGIVYAPPGPNSSVTYNTTSSQSTYMGNSTDTSGSFTNTMTVSDSWGGSIFAWLNGKIDFSHTTTDQGSYATSNGNNLTTTMKETVQETFYGTPVPWTGWWTTANAGPFPGQYYNMHNYDSAILWLNPVLPFTAASSSDITWYGYGYDYCYEGPYMEIYAVQLGNLAEGSGMPPDVLGTLNRGWTASSPVSGCDAENFNSGDGALTTTDYNDIIAADPVYQQSYQLTLNGNTSSDGRYTVALFPGGTGAQLQYSQGGPTQGYSVQYTSSSEITSNSSYSNSQTLGTTVALSGTVFFDNFQSSLTKTNTITTKYSTQNDFTNSTSKEISVTIVPPPCNLVGGSCDPIYDGPQFFDVYQDDLFGTFMFWPVQN